MNLGIEFILQSMGITLPTLIFLVVTILSLIFFATDFKIGLLIEVITQAVLFMWFYSADYITNWKQPLIAFLISIVLLSLSLYFQSKTTS